VDWERCLIGWVGLELDKLEPEQGSLCLGNPITLLKGLAGRRALIIGLGGPGFIMVVVLGLNIGVPGLMGGLAPGIACLPLPGNLMAVVGPKMLALPRGTAGLVLILAWYPSEVGEGDLTKQGEGTGRSKFSELELEELELVVGRTNWRDLSTIGWVETMS